LKILVHACCGPCVGGILERLLSEGHTLQVFYYNPNTYPKEEYVKRLQSVKKIVEYFNVPLVQGSGVNNWEKEHEEWKNDIKKLWARPEILPEGGARCWRCYSIRLKKTAQYAKKHGFDAFTSSLIMGPMKNLEKIIQLGKGIGEGYGIRYLAENFRKKGGYTRSIELSKLLGLYRQTYCGCEYSMR